MMTDVSGMFTDTGDTVTPFTEQATSSTEQNLFETEDVEEYIKHMVMVGVENDWASYEKEEIVKLLEEAQTNSESNKTNILVEFRRVFKKFIDEGGFCRLEITNKHIQKYDVRNKRYEFDAQAKVIKVNDRDVLDFTQEPHKTELASMIAAGGKENPPTGSTNLLLYTLFNIDEDVVPARSVVAGPAKKYVSQITPSQLRAKCFVKPKDGPMKTRDIFEAIRTSSNTGLSALQEDYNMNNRATEKPATEHPYAEYERASKARRIDRNTNNHDGYFW